MEDEAWMVRGGMGLPSRKDLGMIVNEMGERMSHRLRIVTAHLL